MVPNIRNAMSNLVASLQGDGTVLSTEWFGSMFTLFQYQPKSERQQFYQSTLFNQNILTLGSLCQNYQSKVFKIKVKDNFVARAFK